MLSEFLGTLARYSPIIISMIAQITFLVLPVNLRNWDDDLENALTYVGVQLLAAALFFVVVPQWADLFTLTPFWIMIAFGAVLIGSWFRMLRLIPLELTDVVIEAGTLPQRIDFNEHISPTRIHLLSRISEHDQDVIQRRREIKESLSRKHVVL